MEYFLVLLVALAAFFLKGVTGTGTTTVIVALGSTRGAPGVSAWSMLLAAAWPADAVLIAGDLFEHDRVTRDTVKRFHSKTPV